MLYFRVMDSFPQGGTKPDSVGGLKPKTYLFLAIILILFTIGAFAWFLLNRQKVEKEALLTPPAEEVVIKFLKADFEYTYLKSGETASLDCHYEYPAEKELEVITQVSFFAVEPLYGQPEARGKSFPVYSSKEKVGIEKGEGVLSASFAVPENFPSGVYRALFDVYTWPDYQVKGGCSSRPFEVKSLQEPLLILGLTSPQAQEGFLPVLYDGGDNLSFSLYATGDFQNLTPKIEVFGPVSPEKHFEKELPPISFARGKEDYKVNLADFEGRGVFLLELSFRNSFGELISLMPRQGVYFGFPPQIEKAEIATVQKNAFEVKVDYGGNTAEDDSLFLLAVIRDESGKECGVANFDLGQKWPKEFTIGNFGLCDEKVGLTVAIGAKTQNQYLSVFK